MDPMVSARVPRGLRDQVNEGLRSIGSSPTELINRAYESFLATGILPGQDAALRRGKRSLTETQLQELKARTAKTTFDVPESFFAGRSYEDILASELKAAYEALS